MGAVAAACLLVVGVGLWLLASRSPQAVFASPLPAGGCLLGGALLGSVFVRLLKAYRSRERQPMRQVKNAVVIDGIRCLLRTPKEETLSSVSLVKVGVRIAWWDGSRGLMRDVVLAWPGGRRVVFKTPSRRVAREVAMALHAELLRPLHGAHGDGLLAGVER